MRAVLVILTVLFAIPASACSCYLESEAAKRARATAVFDGVVVAKRVIIDHDPIGGYNPNNEYVFAPIRIWKGPTSSRITMRGAAACTIEFTPGRRYIVYAVQRHDDALISMPCGPTASYDSYAKYGDPGYRFEVPLARFSAPASLPGKAAETWYAHRANLIVGFMLLDELTKEHVEDDVRTAAMGIAVTGFLAVVMLLIGAAASFRKRKRALALLIIAVIVAVAMLMAAGRVYLSFPGNSAYLRWQYPLA